MMVVSEGQSTVYRKVKVQSGSGNPLSCPSGLFERVEVDV